MTDLLFKRKEWLFLLIFLLFTLFSGFSESYISPDSIVINSNVVNSIINHSVVDSSTVLNSTILYSHILNSTINNLIVEFGDVRDDILYDGIIRYCDYVYVGSFFLSQIYSCVAPSSVGIVYFSKQKFKPGDNAIVYYQNNINYDVNITIHFFSPITGKMRDDGTDCDSVANDGVYCFNFTVPSISSGNFLVNITALDRQGNVLKVAKILEIDSSAPIVYNIPFDQKYNYNPIVIEFDTNEDAECRISRSNLPFDNMPYILSGLRKHTISFILNEGINTIYYACKDIAGNIVSGNFNLYADFTKPSLFQTLDAYYVYNKSVFGFYYFDINPKYDFQLFVDSSRFTEYKNSSLTLPFDGTYADRSFYARTVTQIGSDFTYGPGYYGSAIYFSSNCLRVNHDSLLNPNPNLGISFWIKTTATSGVLIDKMSTTSGYMLRLNNGRLEAFVNGQTVLQTENSINDDQWHHVLFLIDNTNKRVEIVIDGSKYYSGSFSGNVQPTENLFIGCNDGSSDYYSGAIDELVIFPDFAYTFEQRAFNAYFPLDTTLFSDGLHYFRIVVRDDFNNFAEVSFSKYVNNFREILRILNLEDNAILKAQNITLRFLAPSNTKYITLNTNCGFLSPTIYSLTTIWGISQYSGSEVENCYIIAKAYDFENNLLAETSVSNITIDGKINFDFSLPSRVNVPFLIDPVGDPDIQYYDIYICNIFLTRISGSAYVNPSSYGLCSVMVVGYDRAGNTLSVTKNTFIDFSAPLVSVYHDGKEVTNNQIFKGMVRFDIIASDDSSIVNYTFCIDGNCTFLNQNFIEVNTLNYLQGSHQIYACAKDELNNTGCSRLYFVIFDNLIGNYSLFVYDLVNDSYIYGVKTYVVHLPQNTYNLKIFLNTTIPTKIFDGLETSFILNTTQFPDGAYLMWLEARDNLNNLLANVSYRFFILNAILPAPVLQVLDRYDRDGIINLSWNPISGAVRYAIYRAFENDVFYLLTYTTSTQYFDYVIDGVYKYYVVAIDAANKEGMKSNINITEVRRYGVIGVLSISEEIVKPNDIITVRFLAFDNRTLFVNLTAFGSVYPLYFDDYTIEGYLYQRNITVPNQNGVFEFLLSVTDLFGFSYIFRKYISVDNIIPTPALNLHTLSARGFVQYNQSVTALPFIYYDVATGSLDECLVMESVLIDEFSPVTLEYNQILYSGEFIGRPLVKDFALKGNFSKSISLNNGTIFSRFYIEPQNKFSMDLGVNFIYNGSNLNFCSHSIRLDMGWHEIIVQFNETSSVVYLDGYSYACNGFVLSQVSGINVTIDRIVITPSLQKDFSYKQCSGGLYLTTYDGNKTVFAVVRDLAGNVNITQNKILLDRTGAKLDITPPSEPSIVVPKKWINLTDYIEFAFVGSYDFEQSLLNLPLQYEYELYKNENLNATGITNSTKIIFYYNGTYQQDDRFYLKVRSCNLAGYCSNWSISDNVTADLTPPSVPLILSTTHMNCIDPQGNYWTNAKIFSANWTANDLGSGVQDYAYGLYTYNISAYNVSFVYSFVNSTNVSIPLSVDGELYFYVAARDLAGNIGDLGVFRICSDFTMPTQPKLIYAYQIENTTILTLAFTKSLDFESKIIRFYEVQVLNFSSIVFSKNYTLSELVDLDQYFALNISGLPENKNYYVRVRSYDAALNPSYWSDNTFTELDTTPPLFLYTTPSGIVINDQVKVTVKTDEVAYCRYSIDGGSTYYNFLYSDSTFHETMVYLPGSGNVIVDVVCINKVGLFNTTQIVFNKALQNTLAGASLTVSLATTPIVSETLMSINVQVLKDGMGIANIPRNWFKIIVNSSDVNYEVKDFSMIDFGGGQYLLTFKAPRYNSMEFLSNEFTFTIVLSDGYNTFARSITSPVDEFIGYFQLEETSNSLFKMLYNVTQDYAYGIGVDDSRVFAVEGANAIKGDLSSGSFYLFVTTPDFNPRTVESYLYKNLIETEQITFGNLRSIEKDNLLVFIPLQNFKFKTKNLKLDSGVRKIRIVNIGYDSFGNPLLDFEVVE
ncbi:MAG: LamG domain-containing protein [Candidatus Woesearchaeota archaeon]